MRAGYGPTRDFRAYADSYLCPPAVAKSRFSVVLVGCDTYFLTASHLRPHRTLQRKPGGLRIQVELNARLSISEPRNAFKHSHFPTIFGWGEQGEVVKGRLLAVHYLVAIEQLNLKPGGVVDL